MCEFSHSQGISYFPLFMSALFWGFVLASKHLRIRRPYWDFRSVLFFWFPLRVLSNLVIISEVDVISCSNCWLNPFSPISLCQISVSNLIFCFFNASFAMPTNSIVIIPLFVNSVWLDWLSFCVRSFYSHTTKRYQRWLSFSSALSSCCLITKVRIEDTISVSQHHFQVHILHIMRWSHDQPISLNEK